MVRLEEVLKSNEETVQNPPTGLVCVFVGATGGIGAATLNRLCSVLCDSTLYVFGRSSARFQSQRNSLEAHGRNNVIVFLETEVTLLSQIDATCKKIAEKERKVDILYMSAGMLPFNGPSYTKENLDECFVLSYYSRIRLVSNLLILLRRSPHARILSVLNAGKEARMFEDDLGMTKSWSMMGTVNNTTTMHTLAFDHLATQPENRGVVFMHAYPGWVKTDIFKHLDPKDDASLVWRMCLSVLRHVAGAALWWAGVTPEECGERQVFQLLDARYRKGSIIVGHLSEQETANAVLRKYREEGWPGKVWDFTNGVFETTIA